jgi:dienelactone hydrolase
VRPPGILVLLVAVSPLILGAGDGCCGVHSSSPVVVSAAEPPPGHHAPGVTWMSVTRPNLGTLRMAVATPPGDGPFTTLLILHGSHGFGREYVELASAFADRGIQAVAACWFSDSSGGAGSRFVTPVDCPGAPPITTASSEEARERIETLLEAVRQLPKTRADRIAIFGHSRGGGAALNYILRHSGVYAAVLNSTGYPPEVTAAAAQVRAPVLLLHGTADLPADGGSSMTAVEMAQAFEAAVRKAGKPIHAHYYEAARHNELFTSESQRLDEVKRIVSFLQQPDSAETPR